MKKLQEIIGDDLYREVMAALAGKGKDGKNLELAFANDGSFIPKAKFDLLCKENQALKDELAATAEMGLELESLQGEKLQLNEALQLVREEQSANEDRHAQEMEALKREYCLEKMLTAAGAKNDRAVKALLNWDELQMAEDCLDGLENRLAAVKAEAPYLFAEDIKVQAYQPQSGQALPDTKQMSDAEYYQYMKKKG